MTELLKEIEEKIKFLLILKAKPLPPGTVRVWGEDRYRKGTDRKWRKIGRCVQSNLKNIANKKLTRENIEGLKVVSSRQFNEIVDLLFEGRYKDLPNIIRLPNIDKNLAEKLGLQRRMVYLFKNALTHIRPGRKARYGQALRKEEYKMIPNVIREAKEVFIDRVKHNFQIMFSDQKDINKINKIIFNKDKEGNYLVTIGKVDRGSEVKNIKKSVVRDGSCTRNTCSPEGDHPNTRLSASLTTTTNISQNQEKSSPVVEKNEKKERKMDLLKSRSHKYVKRVPKTNGKGYRYFYAKDFKTPFRSLLNFFGIGKARIEKDYEGNHIEKDFGVSKSVFAQHVLHYFLNKAKWDKVFSGTKQKEQKKNSDEASSSGTEKKNPTEQKQKQKTDQPVYSKALMRRIYSIYNGSGQKDPDANEHDNRSRAMLGNENAKKEFSSLSEGEKIEKGKTIKENIVCKIEKDSVPYKNNGRFAEAAREWIKKNHQGSAKTLIGDVIINEKTVDNDLRHGERDKYLKLQTLPAVKDVLEKGTYIGFEHDFNGKNINNHYFSGRIKYGEEEKIVFCRVREAAGDTNRFYVHEVFTDEEIKKEADNAVTNVGLPLLIGKPLYKFILQDVLNVKDKTENISNVTDKEREAAGYPKRELFERYSAVDDATWDPKSKEYRYRDTGYIAGARKELAAGYLISAGKNRARVKDFQIDWEGLEENVPVKTKQNYTERDYRMAKVHFDERIVF